MKWSFRCRIGEQEVLTRFPCSIVSICCGNMRMNTANMCTSFPSPCPQKRCLGLQFGTLGRNGALREHSAASGVELSIPGTASSASPGPGLGAAAPSLPPSNNSGLLPASANGSPAPTTGDSDPADPPSPAQASAQAPSPGNSPVCTLAAGPGQAEVPYSSCTVLQGAAPDFQLLWSVPSDSAAPAAGGRRYVSDTIALKPLVKYTICPMSLQGQFAK
jgi:hypothetical protein